MESDHIIGQHLFKVQLHLGTDKHAGHNVLIQTQIYTNCILKLKVIFTYRCHQQGLQGHLLFHTSYHINCNPKDIFRSYAKSFVQTKTLHEDVGVGLQLSQLALQYIINLQNVRRPSLIAYNTNYFNTKCIATIYSIYSTIKWFILTA